MKHGKYGVITRFQSAVELAYLKSFCYWYLSKLQFDLIHFICFEMNDVAVLKSFIRQENLRAKTKVLLFDPKKHKPKSGQYINSLDQYFTQILTDYILCVDMDEYLYLNDNSIHDFVRVHPNIDLFEFRWLQIPSQELLEPNFQSCIDRGNVHIGMHCKAMALIKKFTRMTIHSFVPKRGLVKYQAKRFEVQTGFYLIHFSVRSLCDVFLKIHHQNFTSAAKTKLNLRNFLENGVPDTIQNVPSRILISIRLSKISNLPDEFIRGIKDKLKTAFDNENLCIDTGVLTKSLQDIIGPKFSIDHLNQMYSQIKETFWNDSLIDINGSHHAFSKVIKGNNQLTDR